MDANKERQGLGVPGPGAYDERQALSKVLTGQPGGRWGRHELEYLC